MDRRIDDSKGPDSSGKKSGRLLSVSEERKSTVRNEVIEGSAPGPRYYVLMTIATLVAGLGLVTNSPAVIIGAMLISPLMTPIFGVSLGLVSGNGRLVQKALFGEFAGVALAILAGFALGSLPLYFTVTPEMIARTAPTLLDLGVALLAGTAGCLGIIDERISPVLPGIAIATSLVPPLAVCGLCLAMGAPQGAWGAFLLFFANFLAILIVSSLLFISAGFVSKAEMGTRLSLLKRFSTAIVGLIFVSVLLTQTLLQAIEKLRFTDDIQSLIEASIVTESATSLMDVKFKKRQDSMDVLATLRTYRALSPEMIKKMEDAIAQSLGIKTNLIVRCTMVRDVSATGSTSAVVDEDLDGQFITDKLNPRVRRTQLAEQAVREMLDVLPGAYLRDLDLIELEHAPVILATVETSKPVEASGVKKAEAFIRRRLEDPHVRLLVRSQELVGMTSKGRVLFGRAHFSTLSPGEASVQEELERLLKESFSKLEDMYVLDVDAQEEEDGWAIRAEVVGPRVVNPGEVAEIEKGIAEASGEKVRLEIWSRAEMLVTEKSYEPMTERQ